MRVMLNRHFPVDITARWWYLFVSLPGLGLVFSLTTNLRPFPPRIKWITIVEGSPSVTRTMLAWVTEPDWKNDLLFAFLGLLLACGAAWLLEEIRNLNPYIQNQ